MTLDDLPEYRAALEEFRDAGGELVQVIVKYRSHGIDPLPTDTVAFVAGATDRVAAALDED